MKHIILSAFVFLFTTNAMCSSEEELSEKPNFKTMLQDCNINPDIDKRVFKAFHSHINIRSAKMDQAAQNELTSKQWYRWRFVSSMNSYGHQAFQKFIPLVNLVTDMFVEDNCNTDKFRTALRAIHDFTAGFSRKGSSESLAQDEINACMSVFDMTEDSALQHKYTQILQHIYHEVGLEKEDQPGIRKSVEEVMNSIPDEYKDLPEVIMQKILARVYISNFNMLLDYMDKWMKQVYKAAEDGPLMDHIDGVFDSK